MRAALSLALLLLVAALPRAQEMTLEEKAAAFDEVVSADPVVTQEPTLAVLDGEDLVLSGGRVSVDLAGWVAFDVVPEDRRVAGFAPRDPFPWGWVALAAAVGLLAGLAL